MAKNSNLENVYKLNGSLPIGAAIPFGLQHILAMFVSNITPIILVTGVAKVAGNDMSQHLVSVLIQNCIFIAGVASLIQIAGVWKIGSRLPIIMGISFTFLAAMMGAAAKDYNIAMGAVIVGGCIEGLLGLCYKYWKGILSPIVSACVVCGIGLSLFTVGTNSFGGGQPEYMANFGAPLFWIIGGVTLITCLVWAYAAKGPIKALSALAGLVVGYILTVIFDTVGLSTALCGLSAEDLAANGGVYKLIDFSQIMSRGVIGLPRPFPTGMPKFEIGAIISMTVIFLVSATETIGDSAALCQGGLDRDITTEETSGSLACDGFASSIAGLFGCSPITSFSQNVGLCAMTKVVNRIAVGTGAVILILAGFFPPLAGFFQTIPQPVLGGCTIMMFGQILVSGFQMIHRAGFSERNFTIAALSLCIGGGFTAAGSNKIFSFAPQIVQDIFASNVVAVVFIVAVVLNLILPKDNK